MKRIILFTLCIIIQSALYANLKPELAIQSIKPTALFKKVKEQLVQAVDLQVEANQAIESLQIKYSANKNVIFVDNYNLKKGTNKLRIYLPDFRDTINITFQFYVQNELLESQTEKWIPQPHWQLHLVHSSHHDLGYTDLPSRVLEEHKGYVAKAIEYCEQTEEWSPEAQFHYTFEQAFSVAYFLQHNQDKALEEKLIKYLKNGQLEVTGLLANQTTDISEAEELNRTVYASHKMNHDFGIPIKVAEINDIPGINWGLVNVLASSGIKYLYAGIQDYFNWGTAVKPPWDEKKVMHRGRSGAFYWQGPAKNKVLLWYGGGSLDNLWLWDTIQGEPAIIAYLQKEFNNGYPYQQIMARVLGGYRDNSLPDVRHSEIINAWNKKWEYPKLIFSTTSKFLQQFEKKFGSELKTLSGDFNQTDYHLGAISTAKATGINRVNQSQIIAAESIATLAAILTDYEYPRPSLAESFERIMLYDEHCWGLQHPSGPPQEAAILQKSLHSYQASALIEDIKIKAINKLADLVKLNDENYYVLVFNPSASARSEVINVPAFSDIPIDKPFYPEKRKIDNHEYLIHRAAETSDRKLVQLPTSLLEQPLQVKDISTGQLMEHQIRTVTDPMRPIPHAASRFGLSQVSQNSQGGLNWQKNQVMDLVFKVRDLPALGYKIFQIRPLTETIENTNEPKETKQLVLENKFYKIYYSKKQEKLNIFDKEVQKELINTEEDAFVGQLLVKSMATNKITKSEVLEVKIVEEGPVYSVLSIKSTAINCPQVRQEIKLYHQTKRIDFAVRLLKNATPNHEYYLAFPFQIQNPDFKIASVNTVMEPIQDQLPGTNTDTYAAREYVAVYNQDVTLVWSSLEAPIVKLSEIWPGYLSQAHHGITPKDFSHPFTDQFKKANIYSLISLNNFRTNFPPVSSGDFLFRYSITSYPGEFDWHKSQHHGFRLHNGLTTAIVKGAKEQSYPASHSFLKINNQQVALRSFKAAEDGQGLIIRLQEISGKPCQVNLQMPGIDYKEAYITNLVEQNENRMKIEDEKLDLAFEPFEIKTIRLITGKKFPEKQKYFYSY